MALFRSLWPLLLAAAILLGANALQTTLLAVRGAAEGFPPETIGLLLSAYYAGLIAGCRLAPGAVRDVGHIRAFTAFASIASAVALGHALIVSPAFWIALRVVTGFCFAGLAMIMESWLNERSTNETRGQVLSVYRIVDFTSVTLLQASIGLFDTGAVTLFALLSIGLSLALVPVALSRTEAPAPPASARLDVRGLWRTSPVAVMGAGLVGLAAAAYWGMVPVFTAAKGLDGGAAGLLLGAIVVGGALAQWPIGWLSDHVDRRLVLAGSAGGAALTALLVPVAADVDTGALLLSGALFGLFALPCFGLALAHANDHAGPGEALSVSGGLLLVYAGVAITGPVIAASLIRVFGPDALFAWIGGIYTVLAIFALLRTLQRAAPERADPYVPVPRTTPAVFALDPRAEGAEEVQGEAPLVGAVAVLGDIDGLPGAEPQPPA